MNINRKISKYNFNKGSVSRIKYIVIHYVGALGGAEDNCRYYGGGNRNASAHYFVTRMYITPAPTHGTSLSVKSADRQKHRRAAMKKQSGIFLQERA